jgi:hypothetical protein
MPPAIPRSFDGEWYRMALWLCPPVFRREHGDEMLRDFDEARGEAAAHGTGAVWTLRLLMAIDLVRTFGVQWLRTGVPAIVLVLVPVHLAVAAGLAAIARHATIPMPENVPNADVLGIFFLAVTVLVLIGMTIILTLWASRPKRRGRR